jgi:hypothetical protein
MQRSYICGSTLHVPAFRLGQPQSLVDPRDEMRQPAALIDDAASLEHAENTAIRNPAEENARPDIHIRLDNVVQHLRPRAVDTGHAVDVEDDVLIMLRRAHSRKGWMDPTGPVEFQTAKPVLQVTGIGECQGLGDFDNQSALDQLDLFWMEFCVVEPVRCSGYFPQDLDPRLCGMADEAEDGEANAHGDAQLQGIENSRNEYEEH